MKVIETLWFTNTTGCIGIVVVEEDVTGDRKAYIGAVSGTNEKADTEQILAWGNKFSLDTALRLRHLLTEKRVIPILSKTLKVNKLPDIAGFIQSMRDLGAKVSVQDNKVVIDFKGGKTGGIPRGD